MSKKLLILAAICLVIVGGIAVARHKPDPKQAPVAVCSRTAPPCIRITLADGTTDKLNDFRFLPNHCIAWVSSLDRKDKQACGPYNLQWIGPETKQL